MDILSLMGGSYIVDSGRRVVLHTASRRMHYAKRTGVSSTVQRTDTDIFLFTEYRIFCGKCSEREPERDAGFLL